MTEPTILPPLGDDEHERLVRTGPGTPAGRLLRGYWQPVALAEELRRDDTPLAVRVLGEDLVLFRDGERRPSLLGLYCPHRGADLSYGRIEDGGLRCIYHGWLFDGGGRCMQLPGVPPELGAAAKIRHPAYPCRELAGVIFAYLGEGEPPPVPGFEAFLTPSHAVATKTRYESNYLIDMEHNLDPGHVSWIHLQFLESERRAGKTVNRGVTNTELSSNTLYGLDGAPRLEIESAPFGLRVTAIRDADPGNIFVRGLEYVYPNVVTAPVVADGYVLQYHVPIDDVSHWRYDITFDRTSPIDPVAWHSRRPATMPSYPTYLRVRNKGNRYLQNRAEMADWFAGMGPVLPDHDGCALEETPPLETRHHYEALGYEDEPIVRVRKLMLDAMLALEAGHQPPMIQGEDAAGVLRLGSFSTVVPLGTPVRMLWT